MDRIRVQIRYIELGTGIEGWLRVRALRRLAIFRAAHADSSTEGQPKVGDDEESSAGRQRRRNIDRLGRFRVAPVTFQRRAGRHVTMLRQYSYQFARLENPCSRNGFRC